MDTALQEVALGNYEEAREQFARAHALFPNARTLRGLGIAEFELRHYVVGAEYLTQSLASGVKPLEPNLRRETEELLARARTYIGELAIQVEPASAELLIDGVRRVAELGSPVPLDVGQHLLEFREEGHATERREVTLRGGQTVQLSVRLAPLTSRAAAAAADQTPAAIGEQPVDAPRSERTPVYKRWWLWTIVGVVVAGAVTGTVVALNAKQDKEYRAVETENTPTGANLQPLWRF
ncbi:MAG TPA: PEGA domain-containing protein [Polyangiales bacterium]